MKVSNTFRTLGASTHTEGVREANDYYATDPRAIDGLLSKYTLRDKIWEPACGEGHLSKRLIYFGHDVYSTDIINRGFQDEVIDFFNADKIPFEGCSTIITNPPFKYATEFANHMVDILPEDGVGVLFLKLQFLEGQKRRCFFEKTPPKHIFVFSKRIRCAKNGDFESFINSSGSPVCYAWFVWEKGYKGRPQVDWI